MNDSLSTHQRALRSSISRRAFVGFGGLREPIKTVPRMRL